MRSCSCDEVLLFKVSNSHKELLQWHEENAKDNPNIILASERCAAGIIEALQRFNLGPSFSPRDVLDAEHFQEEVLDPAHEVVQFYLFYEKWRSGEVDKSDKYLQNLKSLSVRLLPFCFLENASTMYSFQQFKYSNQ